MVHARLVLSCCLLLTTSSLASGCGKSSAQEQPAAAWHVVDGTGAVVGPLVGSSVGWGLFTTQGNVGGTTVVTSAQLVPTGQFYTFLDASSRLWSVNGSGQFAQLEPTIAHLTDDCSGTPYVRWGNPALVMWQGGRFATVTGAPESVVPARTIPPRSPAGACVPYAGAAWLLWPVSTLTSVTPPAVVPPVGVR